MSKERARRRAERERERELAAAARVRRQARSARREAALATVRDAVPRPVRWRRAGGLLARRRRIQNGLVAATFLTVQLVVWTLSPDWAVRAAVAVLSVLLLPVAVTLIFDRRS
jgi:hypothetical protein